MKFSVTIAIHQEDDWYVAKCLENSVVSQGGSIDESIANLREALELYYEDNPDMPEFRRTFITTMEVAL